MKQFFGAFFGSIVGIVIATLLAVVIIVAVVKSSVSSAFKEDKEEQTTKSNSILKLTLDGQINDREKENPFKDFGAGDAFGGSGVLGLNTLSQKINAAKTDTTIKGIYINLKQMASGFAVTQELRDMLVDFKKSGKFVYCYSEYYSQQGYFLASAADKIFIHPNGTIEWKGLYSGLMFFKKALDKLEIDVQVFRHGKFKSAVEPFLLDKMSQSNRYQSEIFVGSIWNSMLTAVSKDRKIGVDELNRMANTLEIQFPEDAKGKLVDVLAYEDEVMSA
jgi:protease IV